MKNKLSIWLTLWLVSVMFLGNVTVQAQGPRRVGARKSSSSSSASNLSLTKTHVKFQPNKKRDPMLSPDDLLLLEHREKQRLAALEAERQRKEAEERKRREEEERRRQWELALLKDPSMLIRDKIHIGGIIDKEVLIGGKLYTIGNTYMGAKIVSVDADSVTFLYKGHKFVKKVKL